MGGVFKALGDPTRREILSLLRDKDRSAGEIAEHFEISKPAISKHLDILKEAELVSAEKQGLYRIYSINLTVLQETVSGFMDLFEKE
ncbi:MAG: autorepressor SdpR family transcription factor [Alkalibacterium gilvum]|uniref:autorepressor SdpR family transcription factor n=1 Tax=Alkalibacterium TaxID=99906 RepID=UPI002649BF14|nr:autorepressor SdpR family transcription factor [Alkalibacterium sp.]MDN6409629.1 autorepressor SdpR family transcription factor [Tetragenococcus halophilus]MDN6294404.1 autorepressor SdpR family transcription factor [Alkalibacterium sp.]MDN6296066.1 autorepressor SdpR family transcription factor [Alkalibacterium sp.]MDN6398046.1 autorepressor SdpR family transcription factor [Alkalibacterium sp.]MDN6729919.1 autorepressor SdpR family transcription factor [Alkalibacterium sp.]